MGTWVKLVIGGIILATQAMPGAAQTTGAAPVTGQAVDPVERLGWIAGCWEGTLSSGATYEESWLAPRAGTLIGMARLTRDDRMLSFEFIRIADDQGTLVYSAQPSGRPPTHFRATALTGNEAKFENPEHDFPQRILYRLTPPDALLARIEGLQDGQPRHVDFPLHRVACPGAMP